MGWFFSYQAPSDVQKGTPSNGNILVYNSTTLQWELSDKGSAGSAGYLYLGDPLTNGTWRIIVEGNNLNIEKREAGVWVAKSSFTP